MIDFFLQSTTEEFEARVTAGGLHEGTNFDAKREPRPKNSDIATDIAAMATFGGTSGQLSN